MFCSARYLKQDNITVYPTLSGAFLKDYEKIVGLHMSVNQEYMSLEEGKMLKREGKHLTYRNVHPASQDYTLLF